MAGDSYKKYDKKNVEILMESPLLAFHTDVHKLICENFVKRLEINVVLISK